MGLQEFSTDVVQVKRSKEEIIENCVKIKQNKKKEHCLLLPKDHSMEDREEGEIVDDYEFIISSDEELCMRQRIEELEATNEELEQIAKIAYSSGTEYTYANRNESQMHAISRCPFNPIDLMNSMHSHAVANASDVSSLSSVDFPKVKKRKHRKPKAFRGTVSEYHHNKTTWKKIQKCGIHYQNQFHHTKLKHTFSRVHNSKNSISLNSYDSSDLDKHRSDGKMCILSREELRVALAHPTSIETSSRSLKDRLEKEKNFKTIADSNEKKTNNICTRRYQSIQTIAEDQDNSSDSVSLEEQELRLIALKSAVMKKHLARKKRDEEVAYSPTDFEDMLGRFANVNGDDDIEVFEVEMENLEGVRNNVGMSPISSPKLYLNCERNDHFQLSAQFGVNEFSTSDNTKLIDMDIANSGSEAEFSPHERIDHSWQSLKQVPLPIIKMPKTKMSYGELDGVLYPTSIQARQFVDHSLSPIFSNIENQQYFLHSNAHIYPPTNNISKSPRQNPIALDVLHINDKNNSIVNSGEKIFSQCNYNNISAKDENEEESLRALLLSKLSSSQPCTTVYNKSTQDPLLSKALSTEDVDDPETLRSFLLKSMDCRKSQGNHTETILKEAVRRLQTKSYPQYKKSSDKDNDRNYVKKINENCDVESRNVAINLQTILIDNKIHTKQCMEIANKFNDFPNTDKLTEKGCKWPNNSLKKKDFSDSKKNINNVRVERSYEEISDIYNLKTKSNRNCKNERTESNNIDNKVQEFTTNKDFSFKIDPIIRKNQTITFSKELNKLNDTSSIACFSHKSETCNNKNEEQDQFLHDNKKLSSNTTLNASNKTTSTNPQQNKYLNLFNSNAQSRAKAVTAVKLNYAMQVDHKIDSAWTSPEIFQSQIFEDKALTKNFLNASANICEKPSSDRPLSNDMTALLPSKPVPISRYISRTAVPKVQVKKLVITLRASDSETSDDDVLNLSESQTVELRGLRPENEYNSIDSFDNASPISLLMEGPDDTLRRTSSPSMHSEGLEPSKSVVSDCFKRNLDTFLKNVRSQVQQASNPADINEKFSTGILKNFLTPAAVKHLPYASQQEYRRLVHRMQMLEKQKHAKNNSLVSKSDMLQKYESYILTTGACINSSLDKSLQLVQEAKQFKKAKLRYEKRLQELRSEMDVIQQKLNREKERMSNIFPKICKSNQELTTLKQRHNKLLRSGNNLGRILKGEDYRLNNDIKQQIAMKSKILAMEIKIVNSMQCSNYEDMTDSTTNDLLKKNNQNHPHHKKVKLNDSLQSSETTSSISKKKGRPSNYNATQSMEAPKSLKTVRRNIIEKQDVHVVQRGDLCLQRTVENNIVKDSDDIHEPIVKRCKNADTVLFGENHKLTQEEDNFVNKHTNKYDATRTCENKRIFVPEYISPLEPLKTPNRLLDPNGIICPYDLMGQCLDESCNYEHLRSNF